MGEIMKYVLITGGAIGLGKELVKVFAHNNYNVIIGYNNSEKEADELCSSLNSKYSTSIIKYKIDITNEENVKDIFNMYDIDILINNAALSMDNYIEDKTIDEFMNVLKVNIGGTFLMCKYAKNASTIINIASTDGINTYSPISLDYSCSKAAIINLSKNLSIHYKDKKVLCICPNWINTESVLKMNPLYLNSELKRIGQKELLDKKYVADRIFDIFKSDIESGSVIVINE